MLVNKPFVRKVVLSFALMAGLLSGDMVRAQIDTGKIEGVVRDKDTGQPLSYAQVVVDGTRLGNVTSNDGYYFILNIPPGSHTIRAISTGYQTVAVEKVEVMAGHTSTVNFNLPASVYELDAITVESEPENLIIRDNTMSKQRQTGEQIGSLPVSNLDDVIGMQAGVVRSGDKISLRGGRYGEEAMYVDGVLVKNFSSESTVGPIIAKAAFSQLDVIFQDQAPDNSPLDVGTNAVEEVAVITGGFQAEYGDAKSGVINIVTKEGRDFYSGNVSYLTDAAMPRSMDFGFNQLQASAGGPVPLVPDIFFFGSLEAQGRADWSPTDTRDDYGFHEINQTVVDRMNEMIGTSSSTEVSLETLQSHLSTMGLPNPARRPGNFGDRYSIQTKLTTAPIDRLKIIQTYSRSRVQRMLGSFQNSFVIENNNIQRSQTTNVMLGADYQFIQNSTRASNLQFRASFMRNFDIVGQAWEYGLETRGTVGGFGWDDLKAWPEVLQEDPAAFFAHDRKFIIAGATDIDWKAEFDKNNDGVLDFGGDTETAALLFKPYISGAFSDYDHTPVKSRVYHGPWGVYGSYFEDQLDYQPSVYFSYIGDEKYNFKLDWDTQLNRYNRLKVGGDVHLFKNNSYNAGWSNPTLTTIDNEPYMFSAYAQNRLDLGDFVMDFGIRVDHLDPRGDKVSPYADGTLELTRRQTRKLTEIAPRLGVAFPVTDRTQMRFSFGYFYQPPSWKLLLQGDQFGSEDALLDYSKTIMLEAGFTALLSDNLSVDMVGYYRNIEGDLAYRRVRHPDNPEVSRVAITNMDYGNVKGLDANIQWRYSNLISTRLNYTLQFARSTGTDPTSKEDLLATLVDNITLELTNLPAFVDPVGYDQTHKLDLQFYLTFPQDFKSNTLTGKILRNVDASTTFQLHTGRPYDLQYQSRSVISLVSGTRGPTWKNCNLRIGKTFILGGNHRVKIYGDILNLFYNRSFRTMYNPGAMVSINKEIKQLLEKGTPAADATVIEGLPIRVNAMDEENYPWQKMWDLNDDGWIGADEWRTMRVLNHVTSYAPDGTARQVRLGMEFGF